MVNPESGSISFLDLARKTPPEGFLHAIYGEYLHPDRLRYRAIDLGRFEEIQLPDLNLFPVEAGLILSLIDTCQKKGMSDPEITHLFPALHISLFAHEPQFRESGEPYFIHPGAIAVEAIEEFDADWQTAALALIHDVKEDSKPNNREVPPYLVYKIYTDLFKGENNENLKQASRDARFLERGMEALHKVRDPKRQTYATLETLKKLCTVFLEKGLSVEDAARIMLVRLLDRRHNLRTISTLAPEKQLEKASETLLYLPFAEALHLFPLRDELARLAIKIIDPLDAAYIDSLVVSNGQLKETYDEKGTIQGILDNTGDKGVIHAALDAPGFYETYQSLNLDPLGNLQRLKLTLVLDEDQLEQTAWLEKAADTAGRAGGLLTGDNLPDIKVTSVDGEKRKLNVQAKIKYGSSFIHIDIQVVGKDEYIEDNAYFRWFNSPDFKPFIGTKEEWQAAASKNLEGIKKRFKQAKRIGVFSDFLETSLAGAKSVFDKKGQPISLPLEGSLFDALWMIYHEDVFRGFSAIIEIEGKRKKIDKENFGMTIPQGAKITGLEIFDRPGSSSAKVQPEHIRMSRSLGVRRRLIELLGEEVGTDEEKYKKIIGDGYGFINHDLERGWQDKLGYLPGEDGVNRYIQVPIDQAGEVFSSYYDDTDKLAYAVGSGKIPSSLYRRLIAELVRVRSDMVYFAFNLEKTDDVDSVLKEMRESGIVVPEQKCRQTIDGRTELQLWFYENQLGERLIEKSARLNRLYIRLSEKYPDLRSHWNKIPLIKAELPEPVGMKNLFKTL